MVQINAEVIGLDIGYGHISAIRLVPEGDKIGTVGVWEVGLPAGVWTEEGRLANAAVLTKALKQLRSMIQPRAKRVYLSIPNQQLILQPTTKPRSIDAADIAASVQFDIEPSLPYDGEFAQVTYSILGIDENDDDLIRILSIATHRDVPIELMRAVQSAGFQVEEVEPEPCIAHRSVNAGHNEWPELIVNVGQKTSSAVVVVNSTCEFAQSMNIGGEHLTEAIHAVTDRSLADAEQFKRRHSLIAPLNDPYPEERAAMVQWADRLVEEIYAVLSYQEQRDPARRIVMVGSGSRLDGLVGYINGSLGIPTEAGEPVETLLIEDSDRFVDLASAYALALRPGQQKKAKKGKKVDAPAEKPALNEVNASQ